MIEVSGKTEEEAIAAGLEQLGKSRDEVSVEVVERSKKGVLGIGRTDAVVRLSYEEVPQADTQRDRVERYLKYLMYHAQNTYPYPEDQGVAEWVREEGEPNGWVKFAQDEPEEPPRPAAPEAASTAEEQPKKKIQLSI